MNLEQVHIRLRDELIHVRRLLITARNNALDVVGADSQTGEAVRRALVEVNDAMVNLAEDAAWYREKTKKATVADVGCTVAEAGERLSKGARDVRAALPTAAQAAERLQPHTPRPRPEPKPRPTHNDDSPSDGERTPIE